MRSLYCIAPSETIARYEEIFERAGLLSTSFEAEGIRSLSAFVSGERAIRQQDYVLIDVEDMTRWSGGAVLTAAQQLREFPSVRLVFIGQPCEAVDDLFRCLRELHHTDVVSVPSGADAEEALTEIFAADTPEEPEAPKAEAREPTATARQRVYRVPKGVTLHFAVAGAMPRCGTTTQAFALYHALTRFGLHGTIRDCAGTLPLLSRYETVSDTESGGLRIRNINFLHAGESFSAYDFVVTDLGVLVYDSAPAFCAADASVLVGCTKPWELPAFANAVELTFGFDCNCFAVVASFSTEGELARLERCLGERRAIAPYQPNIWRPDGGELYERLLAPVLERCCVDETITSDEA